MWAHVGVGGSGGDDGPPPEVSPHHHHHPGVHHTAPPPPPPPPPPTHGDWRWDSQHRHYSQVNYTCFLPAHWQGERGRRTHRVPYLKHTLQRNSFINTMPSPLAKCIPYHTTYRRTHHSVPNAHKIQNCCEGLPGAYSGCRPALRTRKMQPTC